MRSKAEQLVAWVSEQAGRSAALTSRYTLRYNPNYPDPYEFILGDGGIAFTAANQQHAVGYATYVIDVLDGGQVDASQDAEEGGRCEEAVVVPEVPSPVPQRASRRRVRASTRNEESPDSTHSDSVRD